MSVKDVLDIFGENLVGRSKNNLRKLGKGGGDLEKTLDYEAEEFPNSFRFALLMEDYGDFVDAGVKGVGGTKADGSKWRLKKVTNSKYRYKNKKPPAKVFDKWSIRRGIAPRTSGGQFTKRKGLSFALANTVYHTGIETTNFYTKPFNDLFKDLPDDVVEAFGLEVDEFLKQALND